MERKERKERRKWMDLPEDQGRLANLMARQRGEGGKVGQGRALANDWVWDYPP